jgi:DNA polymerase-3 subunit beta
MKFTIEQKELNAAISLVSRAVAKRPSRPILGYILLEAAQGHISLTGFDEEVALTLKIPAEVAQPGRICLPADLWGNIVSRLDSGALTMLQPTNDATMTITCGASYYEIRGLGAEDYPKLPEVKTTPFTLPVAVLRAGIESALPFVSDDATKQVLQGVNLLQQLGELRFAATDGHRLSVQAADSEGDDPLEVTIPGGALALLDAHLKTCEAADLVSIALDDVQGQFEIFGFRLVARILEGQYPNYAQLIPASFQREQAVPRQALIDALGRLSAVSTLVSNVIKVTLDSDKITLTSDAKEAGNGSEVVPLEMGEPLDAITIGFNAKYLLEALKVTAGAEVLIQCNTPKTPVVISPLTGGQTNLIMPIQIRS